MSGEYIPSFGASGSVDEPAIEPNGAVDAGFLGGSTGGIDGGNSGGDSGEFDPTIHVGRDKRNADGSFTRKRGRKSGGGNATASGKKANNQAGIDALTETFLIVHAGIAALTSVPEIELERDDSERLSKATVNVLNEFDFVPSPKVQAIVGLVTTAGMIYGSKYYIYRQRKIAERDENAETKI